MASGDSGDQRETTTMPQTKFSALICRVPDKESTNLRKLRPSVIEAAQNTIPHLPIETDPGITLFWMLDRVSASHPEAGFKAPLAYLMEKLGKSEASVKRYVRSLRDDGWIERFQNKAGASFHGWKPGVTFLTHKALAAFGLVDNSAQAPSSCSSSLTPLPKPLTEGNRWARVIKVPAGLEDLAQRIGGPKLCWLMGKCRKAGAWLQTLSAGALEADDPVAHVLHALKPKPRKPVEATKAPAQGSTQGVNVGQATPSGAVLEGRDAHRAAVAATTGTRGRALRELFKGRPRK